MLTDLVEGLYESIVTEALQERLAGVQPHLEVGADNLDPDTAPQLLARHLHDRTLEALKSLPKEDRISHQLALANQLLNVLAAG